jgi:hypothetical protein
MTAPVTTKPTHPGILALGGGAGQMGMLLWALLAFHFWGWTGIVLLVLATTMLGLAAAAFQTPAAKLP